jgi:AcrR family transcriptional regulator
MVTKGQDLKRPRVGRPPKDMAGDVKARILDAAQRVFLKRGYQSASLDEIAEVAPASKPTIYAHFDGKEALFEAVVARVLDGLTNFKGFEPKGRTVPDKLSSLGTEVVERFIDETIGITRATIAEADRFPALSRHVHEHGRDRAAAAVSHVLSDATHTPSRGLQGTLRPQTKSRHRADFHGSHSAADDDAGFWARERRSSAASCQRSCANASTSSLRLVKPIGESEALARHS